MTKQYSFLLEYATDKELIGALSRATNGDAKLTRQLVVDILREDPHAFDTLTNTGKGSAAREAIRKAATRLRIAGNEKLAADLEREGEKLVLTSKDVIDNGAKATERVLKDMETASSKAIPSSKTILNGTAEQVQSGIDKAKGSINDAEVKLAKAQARFVDGTQEARRKAATSAYNAQRSLENLKGQNSDELISKLMSKMRTETDPIKKAKLSRQIDYLASTGNIQDKISQAAHVSAETAKRENEALMRSIANSNASHKIIDPNLRRAQRTAKIMASNPLQKPSVMRTIKGWIPKVRKVLHI